MTKEDWLLACDWVWKGLTVGLICLLCAGVINLQSYTTEFIQGGAVIIDSINQLNTDQINKLNSIQEETQAVVSETLEGVQLELVTISDILNEVSLYQILTKIQNMNTRIETLTKLVSDQSQRIDYLNKSTEELDQIIINKALEKEQIIQKIKDATLMILDMTSGAQGSGVCLSYKGRVYVLTAGHVAEAPGQLLYVSQDGLPEHRLTVRKLDLEADIAVLEFIDSEYTPPVSVELASIEPLVASVVYLVGSPLGMEDLVSEGRIVQKVEFDFLYFYGNVYYGSSGGGVFNTQGELVGIISHMTTYRPSLLAPGFTVNGAVRLQRLLEILNSEVYNVE